MGGCLLKNINGVAYADTWAADCIKGDAVNLLVLNAGDVAQSRHTVDSLQHNACRFRGALQKDYIRLVGDDFLVADIFVLTNAFVILAHNLIIMFWDLAQADSDLLVGYRSLLALRHKANNSLPKSRIKICLAAEYAEAEVISLPQSEGKAARWLINSDAEERVLKVLPSADTGKYSAVILTHSFRGLLPQTVQQLFCCPCYFFHICCYCVKHG